MNEIIISTIYSFSYLAFIVLLIYAISKKNDIFCRTPGLDIAVALLTIIPPAMLYILFGFQGIVGSIIGQLLLISSFSYIHEITHKNKKVMIKETLNKIVGPTRNYLGLLISMLGIPVIWSIRIGQIIIWPLLVWTIRFPKYNSADWINISRQKIDGLVGHDLLWCLYCDWMTGIYSYGAEMLRNVESFWCPIKFLSDKKCENCKIDFPDIEKWTSGKANIEEVNSLLLDMYPPDSKAERSWFGHSDR